MKVLRYLIVAIVAAGAAVAIERLCWQPYRCDVEKYKAQALLFAIYDLPRNASVIMRARTKIPVVQQCTEVSPTDADMYMTVAALDRVMGRLDHASEMYRAALAYDQRPELYLNLGLLQLQTGQRSEAFTNLARACLFNIDFINEIQNLDDRAEVQRLVREQQNRANRR